VIGKLKGVLDAYGEDFVIIDVHGVGYVVHCSSRTCRTSRPWAKPRPCPSRRTCART
jgi:Holliday junction DNA helicase RuvA